MEQHRSINPGKTESFKMYTLLLDVSCPIEVNQSTGFNITSSPSRITSNEIKVPQQSLIATQSSVVSSSPILQRRRIDQILAPNIAFDNTLDSYDRNCYNSFCKFDFAKNLCASIRFL
jgi:hypothetical protein